jgi:hypothetical protein
MKRREFLLGSASFAALAALPIPTLDAIGPMTAHGWVSDTGAKAYNAIWDICLTDDEIALLNKGANPLSIRPEQLTLYWPAIGPTQSREQWRAVWARYP